MHRNWIRKEFTTTRWRVFSVPGKIDTSWLTKIKRKRPSLFHQEIRFFFFVYFELSVSNQRRTRVYTGNSRQLVSQVGRLRLKTYRSFRSIQTWRDFASEFGSNVDPDSKIPFHRSPIWSVQFPKWIHDTIYTRTVWRTEIDKVSSGERLIEQSRSCLGTKAREIGRKWCRADTSRLSIRKEEASAT